MATNYSMRRLLPVILAIAETLPRSVQKSAILAILAPALHWIAVGTVTHRILGGSRSLDEVQNVARMGEGFRQHDTGLFLHVLSHIL